MTFNLSDKSYVFLSASCFFSSSLACFWYNTPISQNKQSSTAQTETDTALQWESESQEEHTLHLITN